MIVYSPVENGLVLVVGARLDAHRSLHHSLWHLRRTFHAFTIWRGTTLRLHRATETGTRVVTQMTGLIVLDWLEGCALFLALLSVLSLIIGSTVGPAKCVLGARLGDVLLAVFTRNGRE